MTASGACITTCRSSSMPIDVKKTPLKSDRNGMTSDSACRPYSDSEMTRPAINAPIASEKPAAAATSAVPRATNATQSVNSSRSRSSTMRSRVARTTTRPPKRRAVIAPRPTRMSTIAPPASAVPPAASGSNSMIGTMHRSWNRRIAITSRPCAVSSSPRSEYALVTTAVDDIAASVP